jgi:hypothetical protein
LRSSDNQGEAYGLGFSKLLLNSAQLLALNTNTNATANTTTSTTTTMTTTSHLSHSSVISQTSLQGTITSISSSNLSHSRSDRATGGGVGSGGLISANANAMMPSLVQHSASTPNPTTTTTAQQQGSDISKTLPLNPISNLPPTTPNPNNNFNLTHSQQQQQQHASHLQVHHHPASLPTASPSFTPTKIQATTAAHQDATSRILLGSVEMMSLYFSVSVSVSVFFFFFFFFLLDFFVYFFLFDFCFVFVYFYVFV